MLRQPPVQSTDYRRLRESVGRECNYSAAHPHINFQNHRHTEGLEEGMIRYTRHIFVLVHHTVHKGREQREKGEWRKMFIPS
jgi:hypothetical protein